MATYAEQLRDPRWQKRRLEVLERDEWSCRRCGDDESELHVHHLRYITGKKPWEYDDEDLRTLCKKCHADATKLTRASREVLYTMLAEDAELGYDLINASESLLFFSSDAATAVIDISSQFSRGAMNGAKEQDLLRPIVEALFEITRIAQEAERGTNQDD